MSQKTLDAIAKREDAKKPKAKKADKAPKDTEPTEPEA